MFKSKFYLKKQNPQIFYKKKTKNFKKVNKKF